MGIYVTQQGKARLLPGKAALPLDMSFDELCDLGKTIESAKEALSNVKVYQTERQTAIANERYDGQWRVSVMEPCGCPTALAYVGDEYEAESFLEALGFELVGFLTCHPIKVTQGSHSSRCSGDILNQAAR